MAPKSDCLKLPFISIYYIDCIQGNSKVKGNYNTDSHIATNVCMNVL